MARSVPKGDDDVARRSAAALAAVASLVALACSAGPQPQGPRAPTGAQARDAVLDAHALAAPLEARQSVAALAGYLTAPARNDREKARVLYRWIAENIDYAGDGSLLPATSDTSPSAILARGTAVCSGYSDLFTALAEAAGLEAVTVSGYGKGFGYNAGEPIDDKPNHAWNAVRIDGVWQLLDCTWAAGLVENDVYVKRFEPYFFLTPPRDFLYLHLPEDPRWQLVDPPLTRAEFEALPLVRVPFFDLGLGLLSHTTATIRIPGDAADVTLRVPRGVSVRARAACDSPFDDAGLRQQTRGETLRVTLAAPPRRTPCILRFFATRGAESDRSPLILEWALDYRIVFAER